MKYYLLLLSFSVSTFSTAQERSCRDKLTRLAQMTNEIEQQKAQMADSDRTTRETLYDYGGSQENRAIEIGFEQNLQMRRRLFKEYFWMTGSREGALIRFRKLVGELPAAKRRELRRNTIDSLGALFQSGKHPTLWQSDGTLTIGPDKISTHEIAGKFGPLFMQKQTGNTLDHNGEDYIAVTNNWLEQYRSIHQDVENILDEIAGRSFQASGFATT